MDLIIFFSPLKISLFALSSDYLFIGNFLKYFSVSVSFGISTLTSDDFASYLLTSTGFALDIGKFFIYMLIKIIKTVKPNI